MNIYIDFDDCLCETARAFTKLVHELYQKDIPYESVKHFNLQESFGLTDEQYNVMMEMAHKPEWLLALEETPHAAEVVNRWIDRGYTASVITGRPAGAYEASREWLDRHGLKRAGLQCLNKYGRDAFLKDSTYSLELDDFYRMHFDCAIEDSPAAFVHLEHFPHCQVMVFDRPWNHNHQLPGERYHRSRSWVEIGEVIR